MQCEWGKIRSHNTGYCLIEVVTKAGLTVFIKDFLLDNTFAFIVKIINCLEFIRKFSRNTIFINDFSIDNTVCFTVKKITTLFNIRNINLP